MAPSPKSRTNIARLPKAEQTGVSSPSDVPLELPKPHSPLPHIWALEHDKTICMLDARGLMLAEVIAKLRLLFPEMCRHIISTAMIDKRLRVLDQIPEVDHFKRGLPEHSAYRLSGLGISGVDYAESSTVLQGKADKKSSLPIASDRAANPNIVRAGKNNENLRAGSSLGGYAMERGNGKGKGRVAPPVVDNTFGEDKRPHRSNRVSAASTQNVTSSRVRVAERGLIMRHGSSQSTSTPTSTNTRCRASHHRSVESRPSLSQVATVRNANRSICPNLLALVEQEER